MGDKVTVLPLFNGCALLQKVSLGNGITLISASAFSGCSVLTSINLPEGITEIGNQAFGDCKSLTSLYLPSTLTTIRGYAFQSCVFTEITIPANVETIEEYGFWTDNLKKISFEDGDKLISVGKKNFEQLEEATIITTNLAFDRWGEIIRDKVLVAAMVDRLTHNAHLINMNGQSYRLKETKAFNEQK